MAEYIEKSAVKTAIKSYFKSLIDKNKYKIHVLDANADICKVIGEMHDADVVEVKHGSWKMFVDEHLICATEFVCSNCNESFCTSEMEDSDFIKMMKYCPNCGAKMEGVENGK